MRTVDEIERDEQMLVFLERLTKATEKIAVSLDYLANAKSEERKAEKKSEK